MSSPTGSATDGSTPRFLTKTRFKLALECPTKLFYTGKAKFYNKATSDSQLQALAEAGMQVGALACAMHPEGIEVVDRGHVAQVATTAELLERQEVTIFEAAFEAHGLFVRVDILRKHGAVVELIEVKAKTFDSTNAAPFRTSKGKIDGDMRPYLQDVAFQRHVAALARPDFEFRSFLMLPDKVARATVQGLHQRFPIRREAGRAKVDVMPGLGPDALGAPLLREIDVDSIVDELLAQKLWVAGQPMTYANAAERFAAAYRDDVRLPPLPIDHCAHCEFRTETPPREAKVRSGFHECWSDALGWAAEDFEAGTVLDLWNHQRKSRLMSEGVMKLRDVTLESLSLTDEQHGADGMSVKHRQWYQSSGRWPQGGSQYVHLEGLESTMKAWRYPLHFIDFETSAVAVPFRTGQRPYQATAFQFSHHRLHADGHVEHTTQFLEARPAVDPNLPFIRSLHAALGNDDGTVFCWATHENTVLNHLRDELIDGTAPAEDADRLIAFIESITFRKVNRERISGSRCMVDLCKVSERHYFHPSTRGGSSLKAVLPALMRSSERLRTLYGEPGYGGTGRMRSLNHRKAVAWWVEREGRVLNPYELLPPVFSNVRTSTTATNSLDPELRAGDAAMAAYARLQFEDLGEDDRQAIENALLRYCELDTLAMVMAVQAWLAWVAEAKH